MSTPRDRLVRALTRNSAKTDPGGEDPRLRGRTYSVPFQDVWESALALADGGLRGWTLLSADDVAGVITAEARVSVLPWVDDVRIRIALDTNAQTRVDARSASRHNRGDLGVNARRLAHFFRRLDRALEARGQPDPFTSSTG